MSKENYTYGMVNDGPLFFWRIMETKTEQIMGDFIFEEDCIGQMNFLLAGGAFGGWTPWYLLRKHHYQYETDDITY